MRFGTISLQHLNPAEDGGLAPLVHGSHVALIDQCRRYKGFARWVPSWYRRGTAYGRFHLQIYAIVCYPLQINPKDVTCERPTYLVVFAFNGIGVSQAGRRRFESGRPL